MKKNLAFLLFLVPVLFSCKKDKCDLTQANFAGTYRVVSIKYKANASSNEIDVFQTANACEKDDNLTFNANGTYTVVDAGIKCNPSNDDTGTWYLSGTDINIDGDVSIVSAYACNSVTLVTPGFTSGESTTISLVRQ